MTGGGRGPDLPPQVAALLELQQDEPDFPDLGVEAARHRMQGLQARSGTPVPVGAVQEIDIPTAAGGMRATAYVPPPGAGREEPWPVLLYLHGGGWIGGSRQSIDGTCRKLARWSGCVVVAPDYRLAPEAPFPAAVDDVTDAARWLADNGASALGGDPGWLAVGGASSGANLALALALRSRDGHAPPLRHLLLAYPPVSPRLDDESCAELGEGFILTTRAMAWFWSLYCPDPEQATSELAAPLLATSLRGLPPTHLVIAELDPLRDQLLALHRRLLDSEVDVTVLLAGGMPHGFLGMSEVLEDADVHLRASAEHLAAHARRR